MKINLTICGVHEFPKQEGKSWTHVISIWDKGFLNDITSREQVRAVAPSAEVLFSFFEDTDDVTHPDAPCLQDMKRILAFTSQFSANAEVLVHCRAGICRSTATAYAVLCQTDPNRSEEDVLRDVVKLRSLAFPNSLIVAHVDELLDRKGRMLAALHAFKSNPDVFLNLVPTTIWRPSSVRP